MNRLLNGLHCHWALSLQWYFLELRAPNLEFPEGSPTNHSIFACLYFFKVCRTRVNLEWGASVLRSFEVMSKVARKHMAINFKCTSNFASWWEARWTKKYGGDLHEAYDRLFKQSSPIQSELSNPVEVDVGQDEEGEDAFVLQEAAVERERQGAGAGEDVFELLGDSEGEAEPDPLGAEMYQKAKDLQDSIFAALEILHFVEEDNNLSFPAQEFHQPIATNLGDPVTSGEGPGTISPTLVSKGDIFQQLNVTTHPPTSSKALGPSQADLPRLDLASRVTGTPIPRPKKKAKIAATFINMPLTPLPSSLPKLVKKFGQIKTKLQSFPPSVESFILHNARQIFKDWMKRDFTVSFSLKVLHDAEKALIELFKAQLLFFENPRTLRDQHQKVEQTSNKVKCF
ncbi:TMV resistance protein N-like [Pyrus ussuriensis x Pyrus communis]|uniref:TMV resistance protein N-like n=1 Tax=Pyrus ussuriensis x Pyrus communis TaxID=2448454 RepID=A0A5N5FNR0_9ROSA|nr:TMV resistance protein N-like [Pyrus ussuriensis x Pyrus communis]